MKKKDFTPQYTDILRQVSFILKKCPEFSEFLVDDSEDDDEYVDEFKDRRKYIRSLLKKKKLELSNFCVDGYEVSVDVEYATSNHLYLSATDIRDVKTYVCNLNDDDLVITKESTLKKKAPAKKEQDCADESEEEVVSPKDVKKMSDIAQKMYDIVREFSNF